MENKKDLPIFSFKSRAALRSWLELNHLQFPTGIWLQIFKKDSGFPSVTYPEAVQEALCFGWIDSVANPIDGISYKIRYTPRKKKSGWSKVNKTYIAELEKQGLMHPAGAALIALAKEDGSWFLLDEVDALLIPADLQLVLELNTKASEVFNRYPRSAKRPLLEWLNNAKTEKTRQTRIEKIIAFASEGKNALVPKYVDKEYK